MLQKIDTKL